MERRVASARVLYIDDDTVRGWHEGWIAGGMAALPSFDFKGAKRSLDASQVAALIDDLRARLFSTLRAVCAPRRPISTPSSGYGARCIAV